MGFRLGEKGKKALRIGSKVGGIAVALAGAGVLGKKTADDQGLTRTGQAQQLGDIAKEGLKRGDIGYITDPTPVGGGTATAPVQGAVSKRKAVAGAFLGAGSDVILAEGKKDTLKAVVRGGKAVLGAKATSGTEAIQQQQAVAGAQAKARKLPNIAVAPKPQERLSMGSRQILAQKEQAERILAQRREAEKKLRSRRRRR